MKRVFSHKNIGIVHHMKNVLENKNIASEVRGEHLTHASGGVAPTDAWIELWVINDSKAVKAKQIVDNSISDTDEPTGEPWICPNCGEEIEGVFAACWNCGTEQD